MQGLFEVFTSPIKDQKHFLYSNSWLFCHSIMHLSMFYPREGVVGIPLELDKQKITSPGNLTEHFDRTLWHRDGTLDTLHWNSRRNCVYILWHTQGIFDTHLWLMGGELRHNFSKFLIPGGNPVYTHPTPYPFWRKTLIDASVMISKSGG